MALSLWVAKFWQALIIRLSAECISKAHLNCCYFDFGQCCDDKCKIYTVAGAGIAAVGLLPLDLSYPACLSVAVLTFAYWWWDRRLRLNLLFFELTTKLSTIWVSPLLTKVAELLQLSYPAAVLFLTSVIFSFCLTIVPPGRTIMPLLECKNLFLIFCSSCGIFSSLSLKYCPSSLIDDCSSSSFYSEVRIFWFFCCNYTLCHTGAGVLSYSLSNSSS